MEEHLLSSLSMELFLPAEHIPDSLPPKLQLEAVRKVRARRVAGPACGRGWGRPEREGAARPSPEGPRG